jgi:hypothetical protein
VYTVSVVEWPLGLQKMYAVDCLESLSATPVNIPTSLGFTSSVKSDPFITQSYIYMASKASNSKRMGMLIDRAGLIFRNF